MSPSSGSPSLGALVESPLDSPDDAAVACNEGEADVKAGAPSLQLDVCESGILTCF